MANVDRATLKSRQQNLTDRTGEFSSEPLIQKEDQQSVYGDDFMDSALVKLPNVGSINGPSAAFNVDFDFSQGIDRYDIDTTGSVESAFTITLQGLSDNQTGILNITKKSQDTFSFANGLITPFNNTEGQVGQTRLVLFVKVISGTYVVSSGYTTLVTTNSIVDQAVTNDKILDGDIDRSKLNFAPLRYAAFNVQRFVPITPGQSTGELIVTFSDLGTSNYAVILELEDRVSELEINQKTSTSFRIRISDSSFGSYGVRYTIVLP